MLESAVSARELEVAVYQLNNNIVATHPGEIVCPDGFYTYEEKYDNQSHTSTVLKAEDVTDDHLEQIKRYSLQVFKAFKLKDLARIDFFLTEDGDILLNEINTFPGMTPISMFPKMLEANGDNFKQYLIEKIQNNSRKD